VTGVVIETTPDLITLLSRSFSFFFYSEKECVCVCVCVCEPLKEAIESKREREMER
jgi:hypothetical protein